MKHQNLILSWAFDKNLGDGYSNSFKTLKEIVWGMFIDLHENGILVSLRFFLSLART